MLADPITVAARAPFPEIKFSVTKLVGLGSERVDTNLGGFALAINHQPGKTSNRHYVRLTYAKDATDPYSGRVSRVSTAISLAIAASSFGFTNNDQLSMWAALKDTIDHANVGIVRLLADQS